MGNFKYYIRGGLALRERISCMCRQVLLLEAEKIEAYLHDIGISTNLSLINHKVVFKIT